MIHIENVSYRYANCPECCLSEMTLNIAAGECVLLTGPSGCGKTTLTRIINGLIPGFFEGELQGEIEIAGRPLSAYKPEQLSRQIGSVFQNPRSQFFNLDSTSEIAFACENNGIPRKEIRERVAQAVKDLQIEHLLDRNIFELSNGEKQMVAIASAYAMGPDIFVMDEPSANLDVFASEQLGKVISRLKKMGKTIIIAEHRFNFLKGIADRVLYMDKGKITDEWTESEFASMSEQERYVLGLRAYDLQKGLFQGYPKKTFGDHCLLIKDLSAGYRKNKKVVKDMNCAVSAGEIIGIIGRNGQGKTTFAKCLGGLIRESAGEIRLHDLKMSSKKRIGKFYIVMQDPNYQLFSDQVAGEMNIALQKKSLLSYEEQHDILRKLSLDQFAEQHPLSLSGGEKQRLTIAASIAQGAEIIILDEPTSGLDYANMQRVKILLDELQNSGKIIFVITHDYEFLVSTCSRVLHIEGGTLCKDYSINKDTLASLQEFFNNVS